MDTALSSKTAMTEITLPCRCHQERRDCECEQPAFLVSPLLTAPACPYIAGGECPNGCRMCRWEDETLLPL